MKLKQILLAGVAVGVANMAMAAEGSITFDGQVVTDTCTLAVDGSADSTVTLPTVLASDIDGASAGETPFKLNITNCDATAKTRGITLALTPTAGNLVGTASNLLKNTAAVTPAGNVAIQLAAHGTTFSGNEIPFAAGTFETTPVLDESGAVQVPFLARYVEVEAASTPTAGKVSHILNWTITYN